MFGDLVKRVGGDESVVRLNASSLPDLFESAGGLTIGGGLLRVHTIESATAAAELVQAGYPEYAGRVSCFAFDWAGRQFSVDLGDARDIVQMFEIGTGQVLEIPADLEGFFDEEIVQYTDAALGESFFSAWLGAGGGQPGFNECVGYRRPLFLGGVDDVSNLELTDLSVYWTVFGQLRVKTRGLPPGTRVGRVGIE